MLAETTCENFFAGREARQHAEDIVRHGVERDHAHDVEAEVLWLGADGHQGERGVQGACGGDHGAAGRV